MKKWALAIGLIVTVGLGALYYFSRNIKRDWEPLARQRLIEYLEQRFDSEVQIGELDLQLLGGTLIEASGKDFKLYFQRRKDIAPIVAFDRIRLETDLSTLYEGPRVIRRVVLEGLKLTMPPRGERPVSKPSPPAANPVIVETIIADEAALTVLPSKAGKAPLEFDLAKLKLTSSGPGRPLRYETTVTIPKPRGMVTASGQFGPWISGDPRQTALDGSYVYKDANLGVFQGIAGTLASTGKFKGVLEAIEAEGECRVPNFSLEMSGNPVPLTVQYKAVVDGADGDTYLKDVQAKLGRTAFTAKGQVVGTKGLPGRAIRMDVVMPKGDLTDILRLTIKSAKPFLEGKVDLRTSIDIPRGVVHVIEKLKLNVRFQVRDANFTSDAIQDKIDGLSKRGRGKPKDQKIDNVPATFNGRFRMADGKLDFEPVVFVVPGALVDLTGSYSVSPGKLDFHGSLNLDSKMSDTFGGWKRWALKPFNPIFSKNDVGTYLPIRITGDKDDPQFGLDRRKDK